MAITVSVSEDVTNISVTQDQTTLTLEESVVELGIVNVAFSQSNSADVITSTPTGHIQSNTVQTALDELGAMPEFTTALKDKLDGIEEEANKLTAGSNIDITSGVISTPIELANVTTVANETAHLAISPTPKKGDFVIRSDEEKTYIHNGGTASSMADYTELASSTDVVDWSVSQTSNIHPDNYTNTTYSAGTNITIDANNVISSTGGGGGTTNTAGDGIDIDSNGVISVDLDADFSGMTLHSDDLFGDVAGTEDNFYLSGNQGNPFNLFGAGVHFRASDDDQMIFTVSKRVAAFSNDVSLFDMPPVCKVGAGTQTLLDRKFANEPDQYGNTPYKDAWNIPDYAFGDGLPRGWVGDLGVQTYSTGTSDYRLANTEFVANAISALSVPDIPAGAIRERYVTQDQNGIFRNRDLELKPNYYQSGSNVRQRNYDETANAYTNHVTVNAGTGITLTASNGDLTISAQTDGLPAQSSATNGYVLTSDGADADWVDSSIASLPTQSGNNGKYLTTDGTNASWDDVDTFPAQTNNSGKFLTTNGTAVSWSVVDALPTQDTNSNGKYLTSNGSTASWATQTASVPDQTNNSGKYLITNGSTTSWASINTAGQTGDITFSGSTLSSSGSTVTIDDNLTVDGTVNADTINISGSGQAGVDAGNSSYKITAADGVFCNDAIMPIMSGIFSYTGQSAGTSTNFAGSSLVLTVLETASYLRFKITKTGLANDLTLRAQFMASYSSGTPTIIDVETLCWQDGSDYYVEIKNYANITMPNGKLVFELFDA